MTRLRHEGGWNVDDCRRRWHCPTIAWNGGSYVRVVDILQRWCLMARVTELMRIDNCVQRSIHRNIPRNFNQLWARNGNAVLVWPGGYRWWHVRWCIPDFGNGTRPILLSSLVNVHQLHSILGSWSTMTIRPWSIDRALHIFLRRYLFWSIFPDHRL